MRAGLRLFYRHLYVTGMEHIPARGPVIIIANHPSSLMDAALLGVLLRRPLWYFTRGDVFINRPVRKLLSWLHMIPVHQHAKGRATLNDNDDSFSEARAILGRDGIIVFFPESTSHTDRRLWAFRKGVFRLAFQTMADHGFSLRLPIVPIGITYDHPAAGRQCVQVHAGPPLQVEQYVLLYQSNPSAALLRIARDAQERMANHVLHVGDMNRHGVAEQCLITSRNDCLPQPRAWKIASRERMERERAICEGVNMAGETEIAMIKEKHTAYFDALSRHGIEDKTIAGWMAREGGRFNWWRYILLWTGLPLYFTGMVLNGPPVWIARYIADKKVRRDDFYSWIFLSACCLLYFTWMVALVAAAGFLKWWYALILMTAMILTGLFSYKWIGWMREAKQYSLLKKLPEENLDTIKELRIAAGHSRFF